MAFVSLDRSSILDYVRTYVRTIPGKILRRRHCWSQDIFSDCLSKNQNFNPNYGNYSRLDVTTTPCWYGGHLAIPADWRRRWPEVSCERTREAERSRSASLFSAHFAYNICKGEGFLFSFFLLPFLSSKIVDIIAAHSVALVKQSGVSLDVLSEWMAPGVSMYIYTTIWAYYPF